MNAYRLMVLLRALINENDGKQIEVRVHQDGKPPLYIDHLEIMLTEDGDVSEVWLEVTE